MTRPYDPDADASALWELKRAFELSLGAGTGGDEKEVTYREKLTEDYRERYLDWTRRCVDADPDCVLLAERDGEAVGYVFLLPAELGMIWDAAVLNELFVREAYRGTGVVDELLDRALAVARSQDPPLPRIVLDVDPANDRARAVYERHGFEPWGELLSREL